jgi:NAD(P)-dependent dehydrogenase (short-subunit alcohol dehydrogenase family)
MRHSIALVTGTTSGLGYAAARMLAAEGCRQVIVTGRSLARVQKTAAQLAAETNTEVFTPPSVKYEPHRAYADAKCIVAWWAAALARRLPSGMAVYTVSPGSTPDTLGLRNAGGVFKWLLVPMVKLIPGMSHTPETAARRYLQASEFGTDVSGQFFASAPKKFTGPMEAMRHPHFHDRATQEAAWQAVVRVSGVDFSSAAPLSAAF